MAIVSFSQYSLWAICPQKYKLSYVDKLSKYTANIHTIFGDACHQVIQEYLPKCLTESKASADRELNLNELLKDKMRQIYLKESKNGEIDVCTKEELVEFLQDGRLILEYLQKPKNFNRLFTLKEDEIVAIEHPLNVKLRENIHFMGYIDIVIKNKHSGRYRIIDLKTSTKGWNSWHKKDKVKNAQVLIYKLLYSELLGIPMSMIDVEFIILKRKIPEDTEYVIHRISKHTPANGKVSINSAWRDFNLFLDIVFNSDGTYSTTYMYPKQPSKLCEYCEFFGKYCDGK
jgi:hypothetical protein